jgi:hypothetical protein
MRIPRILVVSGTAAAVAGALIVAGTSTISTAAAPGRAVRPAATRRPSAKFISQARAALVKYLSHNHGTAMLVHPARASGPTSTASMDSYNWAGYEDVASGAGTFTKVSGQWTTPAVTCSKEDTITSEWVGIDGWSDATVEQDGTLDWCYLGVPTYFTWYEMYPAGTVSVGTSLAPGDQIAASVTRSGANYTLALTDSTNSANSFSETATCATTTCLDESAEWIAERPEFSIGMAPLANYGTWTLTNGSQTSHGVTGTISGFTGANQFRSPMVDVEREYDLSTTSTLTGGNSFTTAWHNWY